MEIFSSNFFVSVCCVVKVSNSILADGNLHILLKARSQKLQTGS